MNPNENTQKILEDVRVNVKIKLSAAWAAAIFISVHNSFLISYNPEFIEQLIMGKMEGMQITQVSLFISAIFLAIPSAMVFLSLILKPEANRLVNFIIGTLTLVMLAAGVMVIENRTPFYLFLTIMEAALIVLIIRYAWKWPKQEAKPTPFNSE